MICPAIRTVLLGAVALLVAGGEVRAHIPDKLVIDLELGEESWTATSEMDVKFAVVALMHHYLPPDTGSGWIENLNSGQLGLVKDLTEKLYRERFQFAADGERLEMEVSFPDYEKVPLKFALGENDEPVIRVVMTGVLPPGKKKAMTVHWVGRWGPTLALVVRSPGETSGPVLLADLGETVTLNPVKDVEAARGPGGLIGWLRTGFLHAWPLGVHAVFVLGVLLLVPRGESLLTQGLCFAVAHTVTFWPTSIGLLEIPPSVVAPLLAAGVVYIGIENLVLKKPSSWRLGMITGLGLVHGIGLGLAVRAVSIPKEGYVLPIASFQLGVELALLVVLLVGLALLRPFRSKESYAKVRVLGSIAIAMVGLFWTCEYLF